MDPQISVIIPTHKRAPILSKCLRHLEAQTMARDLEVIVIHDGIDEETDALMAKTEWKIPARFESIAKSQQGVARNRGVALASSPLCLFIGDDIFLAPDACEVHLRSHEKLKAIRNKLQAILGHITWDPAVGITPVMQWLEESGWQFGYGKIEQYAESDLPKSIQHRFTYTSNLSLPLGLARKFPFMEGISLYGWEDIEWGQRLQAAGIPLFNQPKARGLHHHHLSMNASLSRMETLGRSIVAINREGLLSDRLPTGMKRLLYELNSLLPTMAGKHRAAFLRGIHQAEMGNGKYHS